MFDIALSYGAAIYETFYGQNTVIDQTYINTYINSYRILLYLKKLIKSTSCSELCCCKSND